jgi:ribosomal protein L40E
MQPKVSTPIVRVIIILVFLAVLSAVMQKLPMLQDLYFADLGITAAGLSKSLILLIMVAMLWNFAREFSPALQEIFPKFPESTTFLRYVVFLISVVMIYGALKPIIRNLIYEYLWVYELSFVLLGLFPVILGGMLLYRSTDRIVGSVSNKASRMMEIPCPHCSAPNSPNGKFCQKCGKELVRRPVPVTGKICPKCNSENTQIADFCSKCGAKLE